MMLKPLEKMYGYGAMAAAGMSSMAGMAGPYYGMHHNLTEAQFGTATAAGMHHHSMAASTFGPTSFGAMVRLFFIKNKCIKKRKFRHSIRIIILLYDHKHCC